MNECIDLIKEKSLGEVEENVSFKALTTYRTGGNAKYVVYPNNINDLQEILNILNKNDISYKVLGNGSNILASDKEYEGIIIKLSNLNHLNLKNNELYVESGYNLMILANDMSKKGYSGLEFACGIPGTVGGAIFMNAGAYNKAMSDIVKEVTIIDENNEIRVLTNNDLGFGYRKSKVSENNWIILSVTLLLEEKDPNEIMIIVNDRKARRIASQPLEYPSAGSVFRNPDGLYAGELIEKSNLKGKKVGGAMISEKHANFIINYENATSSDIKKLIDIVKNEVEKNYNVTLKQEQELFNWE